MPGYAGRLSANPGYRPPRKSAESTPRKEARVFSYSPSSSTPLVVVLAINFSSAFSILDNRSGRLSCQYHQRLLKDWSTIYFPCARYISNRQPRAGHCRIGGFLLRYHMADIKYSPSEMSARGPRHALGSCPHVNIRRPISRCRSMIGFFHSSSCSLLHSVLTHSIIHTPFGQYPVPSAG